MRHCLLHGSALQHHYMPPVPNDDEPTLKHVTDELFRPCNRQTRFCANSFPGFLETRVKPYIQESEADHSPLAEYHTVDTSFYMATPRSQPIPVLQNS